jgi:hypothetical protein
MQFTHEIKINSKDAKIIADITALYPGEDFAFMLSMLRHIFKTDIKTVHYIWLGYLIGERVATDRTATHKSNLISQCQKLN